jgi:hypothetical protein
MKLERKKWNQIIEQRYGGKKFKSTCFPKPFMSTDRALYEVPEDIIKRGQSMNASLKRNPHSAGTDERKPFKPSNPMKHGEGGYISNFIRLEPKEAAKMPQRIKGEKNERPNFKYYIFT